MSYVKPLVRAMDDQTGACSCNVYYRANQTDCSVGIVQIGGVNPGIIAPGTIAGSCVSAEVGKLPPLNPDAIDVNPVFTNTIVGVNDGGAQVTPLAGTGLPATNPITVSAPVATQGIYADVRLFNAAYALDSHAFGATVAGNTILIGLPLP